MRLCICLFVIFVDMLSGLFGLFTGMILAGLALGLWEYAHPIGSVFAAFFAVVFWLGAFSSFIDSWQDCEGVWKDEN